MARAALSIFMRELKAAFAAGVPLRRGEFDDGKTKVVLTFGGNTEATEVQEGETSEPTALDKWRATRGPR
jgi:hypothetical protein